MNVLRPIQKEYYGDDTRWFLGYVINSAPPAGLEGRVKVRIIGVHNPDTTEIPENDLPWAQVLLPTTEGGSSGIGRIPQLSKGAFVFGMFMDGVSSQIPLVMGSLPHTEIPSAIQKTKLTGFSDVFTSEQNRIYNVVMSPLYEDAISEGNVEVRRQQSLKFFIDNGYEPMYAAAITGGLQQVSQFKTYSGSGKQGIAQWSVSGEVGNRYVGLLRFAQEYQPAVDWQLFSTQLQYVLFELRTRFNLANSKLLSANNIKAASNAFNIFYLISPQKSDQLAQRALEEVLT